MSREEGSGRSERTLRLRTLSVSPSGTVAGRTRIGRTLKCRGLGLPLFVLAASSGLQPFSVALLRRGRCCPLLPPVYSLAGLLLSAALLALIAVDLALNQVIQPPLPNHTRSSSFLRIRGVVSLSPCERRSISQLGPCAIFCSCWPTCRG